MPDCRYGSTCEALADKEKDIRVNFSCQYCGHKTWWYVGNTPMTACWSCYEFPDLREERLKRMRDKVEIKDVVLVTGIRYAPDGVGTAFVPTATVKLTRAQVEEALKALNSPLEVKGGDKVKTRFGGVEIYTVIDDKNDGYERILRAEVRANGDYVFVLSVTGRIYSILRENITEVVK